MKFKLFLKEAADPKKPKKVVFAFGRMQPPTEEGHGALVKAVRGTAEAEGADHEIVLSHTQDHKKNPLTLDQKLGYARAMFPGTNITGASKDKPTLLHHLSRLHKAGYEHATVVAGADRVPEYQKLLNHYNGHPDHPDLFNFKSVKVVSAGDRDPDADGAEGMSATKMREHVTNGDYASFRQGVKSLDEPTAQQMFNDVRTGMTPPVKPPKTK
jgi:hypothetical protein